MVPWCLPPTHIASLSPTGLGQFTNLRINFTQLPHVLRQGYHSPSTFYAVTEMQVLGSCFCNGHADRCTPSGDPHAMVSPGMVPWCQTLPEPGGNTGLRHPPHGCSPAGCL